MAAVTACSQLSIVVNIVFAKLPIDYGQPQRAEYRIGVGVIGHDQLKLVIAHGDMRYEAPLVGRLRPRRHHLRLRGVAVGEKDFAAAVRARVHAV